MFTKTCKCGKTTMSFRKLTADTFHDEWIAECCEEAVVQQILDENQELMDNLADEELQTETSIVIDLESTKVTDTFITNTAHLDTLMQDESTKSKKRGRKPKSK